MSNAAFLPLRHGARRCRTRSIRLIPTLPQSRNITVASRTMRPSSSMTAATITATNRQPSRSPPQNLTRHITRILNYGIRESRFYSAGRSNIQGTIGKGEDGVREGAKGTEEVEDELAPEGLNEKERQIWGLLRRELGGDVEVKDISGGCGSMYGIEITSERFRGLSVLKQQRLVNQVLGEEIKAWHGMQLKTRVP